MTAVAIGWILTVLALAEEVTPLCLHRKLERYVLGSAVGAIAKGLALALTAPAPILLLSGLKINRNGLGIENDGICHYKLLFQ